MIDMSECSENVKTNQMRSKVSDFLCSETVYMQSCEV